MKQEQVEVTFYECLDQWKHDTRYESSATRLFSHPSYLRIIGLGPAVLPFIFEELRTNGGHWSVALQAITGVHPTTEGCTHQEAIDAWLNWYKNHGR